VAADTGLYISRDGGRRFADAFATAARDRVTVPADYLASLPADTPAKFEVGAIGIDDNATFTEEDGVCVNEDEGCEED